MTEKKLQQNALVWFKNRYGQTPGEMGFDAAVSRTKRLLFFIKYPQVVFAPDTKTAAAFVKAQTMLETIFSSFVLVVLYTLGIFFCMFEVCRAQAETFFLILSPYMLAIIILLICCLKLRPLERQYVNKIVLYTA